ncbi:MAG: SIMPL domain-containing protein [Limisphaerales bacterium]
MIVWTGSFSTEAKTLLAAQQALKGDWQKVAAFLKLQAVTNYTVGSIEIRELRPRGDYDSNQPTVGYRLSQSVEVSSSEVERVAALDQLTAQLVEQGVQFTTLAPRFIYTKAGEAKIEMLAEATKDARARAEQIASQGARSVKELRSARMGVFQITPLYTKRSHSDWEGENDMTSREKTITAVVNATFSMN